MSIKKLLETSVVAKGLYAKPELLKLTSPYQLNEGAGQSKLGYQQEAN